MTFDTTYSYLLILLVSLSYPAIRYINPIIPFPTWKRAQITAILTTTFVFVAWDIPFTKMGVWSFNPDFILGTYLFGLPLEEILFFLVILYCCLFVYEVGKHYIRLSSNTFTQPIVLTLAILSLGATMLFHQQLYSFVNFLILSGTLFLMYFTKRIHHAVPYFFLAYGLSLIPFFIVNGLLTSLPIVRYNDLENLGIRIFTIPLDDFFYCMSMLFMSFYIYELVKNGARRKATTRG